MKSEELSKELDALLERMKAGYRTIQEENPDLGFAINGITKATQNEERIGAIIGGFTILYQETQHQQKQIDSLVNIVNNLASLIGEKI